MINFSLSVGPSSEKLRSSLSTPFSVIISPAESSNIPFLDVSFEELPRCKKCRAYISNFCEKKENSWDCSICGTKNTESICNFLPEGDDIEVKVNDIIDPSVLCIYIDLGFHPNDIAAIKPAVAALLKSLKNTNVMVVLGSPAAKCSVLVPHVSFFRMEKNLVMNQISDYDSDKYDEIPAPLANFNEFPENMAPFIFAPVQIPSVILSIERIFNGMRNPFKNVIKTACLLAESLPLSPLHFVAIVPAVSAIPESSKHLYESLLEIDIITPTYSNETDLVAGVLPGRVLFFDKETLINMLAFATREPPIQQLLMCVRSKGAKTEWKLLPSPPQFLSDDVLNVPAVPMRRQPFVIDMHPAGTGEIYLQITAKMTAYRERTNSYTSVLRVFNRKPKTSAKIDEIIETVDANALMWLWITRTLTKPPRDVLAATFRVVANFLNLVPRDSDAALTLIRSCCSLKYYGFYSEDKLARLISKHIIYSIPPRLMSMKPELIGDDQSKKTAVSIAGVFTDSPENQIAYEEAYKIGYINTILSPIPEWCKTVDPQALEFLESLLPDD